jgi:hypothetical protein
MLEPLLFAQERSRDQHRGRCVDTELRTGVGSRPVGGRTEPGLVDPVVQHHHLVGKVTEFIDEMMTACC